MANYAPNDIWRHGNEAVYRDNDTNKWYKFEGGRVTGELKGSEAREWLRLKGYRTS